MYTPLAGPNLLEPASDLDPDVDVRGPLTPALGLSIAAQATPHAEGTGGIYLAEGGDSKKVLLVTAHHVWKSFTTNPRSGANPASATWAISRAPGSRTPLRAT
jgi:hypothetical protein